MAQFKNPFANLVPKNLNIGPAKPAVPYSSFNAPKANYSSFNSTPANYSSLSPNVPTAQGVKLENLQQAGLASAGGMSMGSPVAKTNFTTSAIPEVKATPVVAQPVAPAAVATPVEPVVPTQTGPVSRTPEEMAMDAGNPATGIGSRIPTPTVPDITPETQKAVQNAEATIAKAAEISPEELSTQADLDRLIESTKKAYQSTTDQPIPLEFITGQLKSIENRALGLAEPLEAKLARLQATRTSALEASQFALDRADKKAETETNKANQKKSTDTFVDEEGNTILYDTQTGAQIANVGTGKTKDESFTLGKDQIRFDSNGKVVARGSTSGSGVGAGVVGGQASPQAVQLANLIKNGGAKLSDIESDSLKQEVMNAMATTTSSQSEGIIETFTQKVADIGALIDHAGLNSSVGPNSLSRVAVADSFGAAQDFAASVHQLVSQEFLDKLIEVKASGATFGSLTEKEGDALRAAATKLADWEIKDENGNGTGKWNTSESSFIAELTKLQNLAQKAIGKAGGDFPTIISSADEASDIEVGKTFSLNGITYKKLTSDEFEEVK